MNLDATQPGVNAFPMRDSQPRQGSLKFRLLWLFIFVLLGFGAYQIRYDLRSYSLLVHFLDPHASGPLLRWETYAVTTQEITFPGPSGPVRARLYLPAGVAHPPGMVVAYGTHYVGIAEPRLMRFSRAAAGGGIGARGCGVDAL